jgi:hypothetical protein
VKVQDPIDQCLNQIRHRYENPTLYKRCSSPSQGRAFFIFNKLPPELQLLIWEHALPEACVIPAFAYLIESPGMSRFQIVFSMKEKQSGLLSTCKDSRKVFLKNNPDSLPIARFQRHSGSWIEAVTLTDRSKFRFKGDRDIIYVENFLQFRRMVETMAGIMESMNNPLCGSMPYDVRPEMLAEIMSNVKYLGIGHGCFPQARDSGQVEDAFPTIFDHAPLDLFGPFSAVSRVVCIQQEIRAVDSSRIWQVWNQSRQEEWYRLKWGLRIVDKSIQRQRMLLTSLEEGSH